MMTFIFADQNMPFAVSIALMLIIALLEGAATLVGLGISGFLDSLLPEIDMDMDVDMPDVHSAGVLTHVLGWLRFGQVPALVLMVVFLTAFGLIGYILQGVVLNLMGRLLPVWPAGGVAFFCALPMVRGAGGLLARIIPKDETDAVSEQSFIGRIAVITLGTAQVGSPAQGKLTDCCGQTHYVMIEPEETEAPFVQGTEVLLVQQQGAVFKAIRNTSIVLGNNPLS